VSVDYQKNPIVVKEGGRAVLRCKSFSVPLSTVEWFLGDNKLGKSQDYILKLKFKKKIIRIKWNR
jgi:Immunoglobulin I-set domain